MVRQPKKKAVPAVVGAKYVAASGSGKRAGKAVLQIERTTKEEAEKQKAKLASLRQSQIVVPLKKRKGV